MPRNGRVLWYKRPLFVIFLVFGVCTRPTLGQTANTPTSEVQLVEAQVQAALFTTGLPTSLSLNGTFTSIQGSLTERGTAQLTLDTTGAYLISLVSADGTTEESRSMANGAPSCTWTDRQGVVHNSQFINCISPAWFFPGIDLLSGNDNAAALPWTPTSYFADSLGNHLRFQAVLPGANITQVSSSFDLVLAPNIDLPEDALFTAHSDNASGMSIPVRIEFSNYQKVSGVMIPFRIQRFVNGSLVLDLTITTASTQ